MNAVAGLLGNLQEEGGFNPLSWESNYLYNGPGESKLEVFVENEDGTFSVDTEAAKKAANYLINSLGYSKDYIIGMGLVGWTPYTKLLNYCTKYKIPWYELDSQLYIIEKEAAGELPQWGFASYNKDFAYLGEKFYGMSFKDFTTSTKSANWLAACFAFGYEKPYTSVSKLKDSDGNYYDPRPGLCKRRGEAGDKWYQFLNSLPPISGSTALRLHGLTLDTCTPTGMKVSFLASNCTSYTYTLSKKTKVIATETVNKAVNGLDNIDIAKNIEPNTEYSLSLEVFGDNNASYSRVLRIKTPQDYPEPVKQIKLFCKDTLKSAKSIFKLTVIKPDRLGYWGNAGGYDIQLVVNGRPIKTITEKIKDLHEEFTIKDKFGYTCKTGDTLQIGCRVWVKDDTGHKIYDNSMVKVSNTICLLNNPVQLYLNK
jgi:hypothetical protein